MRDKGKAFDSGARFIKEKRFKFLDRLNPMTTKRAFLVHWEKDLGLKQQGADDLYNEIVESMKDLGIKINSFNDFKNISVAIINMPVDRYDITFGSR